MNDQLGPIEIDCDAPPYPIVQACRWVGIRSPEDVRWCHMNHVHRGPGNWLGALCRVSWRALFGKRRAAGQTCTCGRRLPPPLLVAPADYLDDEQYLITQCGRCRTVFWVQT